MDAGSDISDFSRRDITLLGKTKPVLLTGAMGPAVIVIHEVYGFTPTLARFCRWVCDAGFRVYAPVLFGSPDAGNAEKPTLGRILSLCISREFTLLAANKASPVTEWLRALARLAHEECGGRGVGAIGMCLTGGFALSMALEPVVLAPVLAQPGLPATRSARYLARRSRSRAGAHSRRSRTTRLSVSRRQYLPSIAFPDAAHSLRRRIRRHGAA
jgi:dienelactone hydrolase